MKHQVRRVPSIALTVALTASIGCLGPLPSLEERVARVTPAEQQDFLIRELDSLDRWDRVWAAEALVVYGDSRAVPALIRRLGDSDDIARHTAAATLGILGDERAVQPLIQGLESGRLDDEGVAALAKLRDPQALPTIRRLIARGQAGEKPWCYILDECAGALAAFHQSQDVEIILPLLQSYHARTRMRAALALGEMGEARAIPALVPLLDDAGHQRPPDHDSSYTEPVALAAVQALGLLHATGQLAAALNHPNSLIREAAVRALGRIGDEQAVEALAGAQEHPDVFVRRTAAEELVKSTLPHAQSALVRAAHDPSPFVRAALTSPTVGTAGVPPTTTQADR